METGGQRLSRNAGGILSYFTRHRTLANLLLILMIVSGLLAFPNIRAQFFPDVVVDNVSISVRWDGASAEDVDAAVVQVLEPTLLGVDNVTGSSAVAREGSASLTLEFEPGTEIAQATEDVQAAMDAVTSLPDDADDPQIRRGGWSDRVTDVVISGPVSIDQLGRFADEMVIRLFREGVTQASVRGIAAPEMVIEVPALSLIRYDIGLTDIAARIREEADIAPAGDVDGATRVRAGVAKRSADDIEAIVLRTQSDGSSLTVGDVAKVLQTGIDREQAYFVGDDQAIQIRVNRSASGDAIRLQEKVEKVAAEFEATLPTGVSVSLTNTLAEAITGRLNILLENGLMGLGLVLALLFLFLNVRTAFWIALGIPAAMFAAVALMYAFGITLNMISLFALIITLGIVVDDAIVVGEHADFRVRQLGETPVVAAENAARKMFTPVFSATLTTVIAFFGLVIIGGRFGSLIADIPFTVIVVLIASLIECFLILPHHMSHAVAHSAKKHWYDWPSRQVNRGFDWIKLRLFRPFMGFVIWARYPVFAAVVLVLASQIALFVRGDVQWRFFNAPEQGQVTGNFAMLPGATREDTVEMMEEMQRAAEELGAQYEERYGRNPLEFVIAQIGGNSGRGLSGAAQKDPDQLGAIQITLIDADIRPYTSGQFVGELQETVRNHPLAETVSFRSWGRGPGGDSLSIQLSGGDSETLKAGAEALNAELRRFPEISGLEDSLAYDKEELLLELTPQGRALGLSIDGLGRVLRDRLGGIEAASYPVGPRSATIRVQLPASELSADFLDNMLIRTESGIYVPLADIVSVESRTGFSTIIRENGVQLITVSGDLEDEDAERASEVNRIINETILPVIAERFGVATDLSGLNEDEQKFLSDARLGLILVLVGIYLTLAWIFSSWTRPLVVMAIIPFALVGTIYGHWVWDVPLSLFTVVGLIGMVGIVINDSIVLVTTIDEYAEERGLVPAIIDGATDRLRPVMLTTLTTVLGLTPLLYEGSNQAEFLKPTVITLVYGLGFGMVLVLLVVPSLMAMQADVGRQVRAAKRSLRGRGIAMWGPAYLAGSAALVLFAVLFVPIIVTGSPWSAAVDVAPFLSGGVGVALAVFVAAMAMVSFVVYVLTLLAFAMLRRA